MTKRLVLLAPLLAGCLAYDALSSGDGAAPDATAVHDASVDLNGPFDADQPFDLTQPAYSSPIQYVGDSPLAPVTSADIRIAIPPGTQMGDYVLMAITSSSLNTLVSYPPCTSGPPVTLDTNTFSVFWCVHLVTAVSEVEYAFTFSSASPTSALATSYRDAKAGSILYDKQYDATESQPLGVPSGSVVVAMLGYDATDPSCSAWAAPTGFELLPQVSHLVFFEGGLSHNKAAVPPSFPFTVASTDDCSPMLTAFVELTPQ